MGRSSAPHDSSGPQPRTTLRLSTLHDLAIDRQMNADSSRAIAVAITVRRLPFRSSDRKRPHSLVCDDGGSVFPAHANTGDTNGPFEACPVIRSQAR